MDFVFAPKECYLEGNQDETRHPCAGYGLGENGKHNCFMPWFAGDERRGLTILNALISGDWVRMVQGIPRYVRLLENHCDLSGLHEGRMEEDSV